ncbi:MAG: hypothetical protein AAF108_11235 [Planctomycetota bacterium]
MVQRLVLVLSLIAPSLASLGVTTASHAQDEPYATADALLDAIERHERAIRRLSAGIRYERVYGLVGDVQTREGLLYFEDARPPEQADAPADENVDGGRSFAVRFERLYLDDVVRDEEKLYLFDGEWVTELIPENKQYFRRQVAPPGETIDPLSLDSGQLPIPIGQRKADILQKYDVVMVPPLEGLFGETAKAIAARASQVVLTPKRPGGDFEEIRLWYTDRGGVPVPVIARTINTQGDEATVLLVGLGLNDDADIPPGVFRADPPPGFDVQETPWRQPKPRGAVDGARPTTLASAARQPGRQPGRRDGDAMGLTLPGQPTGESERPTLAPAVAALLGAPYLSEEEAKDLRVFHGSWRAADLDTPERRARAALITGDFADPVFDDPEAPALLRADAMLERGEFARAIELLDAGDDGLRARRIRAEAAFRSGDFERAEAELSGVVSLLARQQSEDAADTVEGVRALVLRARLVGPDRGDGSDFGTLISLLARARNELDRLYWPANLVEAELLYDKDNRQGAYDAAKEVLRLNPASARAWALLGELATDRLAIDETESIAERLHRLAASPVPPWSAEAAGEDEPLGIDNASTDELVSPLGALALARARLRQDDPASALAIIADARERTPEHPGLRAMLAAAHAMSYDLDAADEVLAGFDGVATGHYWAGWALSERRQYAAAARYLEAATRREPNWSQPWIKLGLLETQAGRDVRAADALEIAFGLDPFNVRADNTLRLLRSLSEWETIDTDHFVIRFREGIDRVLAEEMAPLVERVHARVTGAANNGMAHEPGFKTVVELMPDHQSFAVRIVGMPSLHTVAAATGPVIAMEAPRESPEHTIGPYDWLRVFQHEFTHTVTLDRTAFRIPLWFTEAAAQLMEDAPRDERSCRLLAEAMVSGGLFGFDEINIKFARPEGPRDRELAYAQGLWMYEFIIERYGAGRPIELMDAYARGVREVDAVPEVLVVSLDAFRSAFLEWAAEECVAWGLVVPDGLPTLGDLLRDADVGPEGPDAARLDDWLTEFPDHPELLELVCSVIEGVPDDAEAELLRRYAAAVPVAEGPHRLLARYELERLRAGADAPDGGGDPRRAIEHLEFLDARAKYTPAYAAALAERYAQIGELTPALSKATRATTIAPYDAAQRELAARVAIAARDLPAALRHLEALRTLEPDRPVHERRIEKLRQLMGASDEI